MIEAAGGGNRTHANIAAEAGSRAGTADLPWPQASAVGGWRNRAFDPEIDLIGADRAPVATKLWYAGSVTCPAVFELGLADFAGLGPRRRSMVPVACQHQTRRQPR